MYFPPNPIIHILLLAETVSIYIIHSSPSPFLFLPSPRTSPYWFRIISKCLMTVKFASINRSTQFAVHDSSPFSSFPLRIVPVTHFFQQTSVRECTAVDRKLLLLLFIVGKAMGMGEVKFKEHYRLDVRRFEEVVVFLG
jgi:hypothetical protein